MRVDLYQQVQNRNLSLGKHDSAQLGDVLAKLETHDPPTVAEQEFVSALIRTASLVAFAFDDEGPAAEGGGDSPA